MSTMVIVYWTQTGNTEAMANAIAEGAKAGGADVSVFSVSDISPKQALSCDLIALGCPAMGDEVLEESEFEPFFTDLEGGLKDKKVALFGSYGWGDGQWMRDWQERTTADGARLYQGEGLILNEAPDDAGLETCREFGRGFASF